MTETRPRLPAAERRAAVVEAAARVFAASSYRGTTTAEIAREAGVSEPVLYRHFASKRELYLASLEHAWAFLRRRWVQALADEPDPGLRLAALGQAYLSVQHEAVVVTLWVQALTEAADDLEIRRYLADHLREVHAFVAGVIEGSQADGGILPDRDARAEAWIFLSLGLFATVASRLDGLVAPDDFARVFASRRRWLAGKV